MGNLNATQDFLSRALAIAPDDPNALFNVGLMNDQSGDTDKAIEFYRRAVDAEAGFADPMVYLANALMRKGQYVEAAGFYAQAGQLHSEDAAILHLESLAHLASGQCERAMAALNEALAISPGSGQALQTRARTYATCPAATDEQKRIALDDAGELYTQVPNLEHAETLAMAKAALGQYQDAADYQAQAMFEAIKAGGVDKFPGLQQNMERYRDAQPPLEAWPVAHPVFFPPPPDLTVTYGAESSAPESP
jgi:predicted O-linked N-acetylglucosamine transferase (SPINDLY family)